MAYEIGVYSDRKTAKDAAKHERKRQAREGNRVRIRVEKRKGAGARQGRVDFVITEEKI